MPSLKLTPEAPDRLHIDLRDEAVVRHWVAKTGKTKEQIAQAIEKVGTNIESVERELGRT